MHVPETIILGLGCNCAEHILQILAVEKKNLEKDRKIILEYVFTEIESNLLEFADYGNL